MTNTLVGLSWRTCDVYDGLNRVMECCLAKHSAIKVLVDHSEPNENIWGNTDERLVIFRTIEEGWYGYFHLYPAGYSSYTYDPDEELRVYKTGDLDWFARYVLTEHMRNFSSVRRLLDEAIVDEILLGDKSETK
jgi:hypothetical protein